MDLVPLWRGNQPLSAREHPVGILLEGSGRVAGDYELRRADGFRALLDVRGKSVGFTLEDFALVMVFAPATARHETVATQRDEITRLEAANRELAERSAAAHLVLSTLRYDLRGAIEDERKYLLGAGSSVSKDRFDRFIRKVGELLDPVV
ncbi:MAG: hypothetical protein FJ315_01775 [SAR202 cluster bacterium]|nr:hypothetical protein [SAR202 cluster bacterium]